MPHIISFSARYLIALIALLLSTHMTVYPAQADIRCVGDSNINIEIGNSQVSIPIDYKIHIISLNGTDITPVNRETWAGCKKSKLKNFQQHMKVKRVGISGIGEKKANEIALPSIHNISIRLYSARSNKPTDFNQINKFYKRTAISKETLFKLPIYANFFAFKKLEDVNLYVGPFMSTSEGMKTPNGNAIVFECYGDPAGSSSFSTRQRIYAMCTVDYDWAPNVSLHYTFSSGQHYIETWARLDQEIRHFVEKITVRKPN